MGNRRRHRGTGGLVQGDAGYHRRSMVGMRIRCTTDAQTADSTTASKTHCPTGWVEGEPRD
jgi:hypothetical protein